MKTVLKNVMTLALIVGVVLLMSGCKDDEVAVAQENANKVDIKVIEGFPSDFMPLHKAIKINESTYWVRENSDYIIGKDIYMIDFESSASKDNLSKYYKGLIDELDKDMSYDDYTLAGQKGTQRVSILISDPLGDNAKGNSVSITFGVPKEDYATTNKYFDLDPANFMDMAFVDHQVDYMYRELYNYNQKQYFTSYVTTEDPETIVSHYRGLYENADSYTEDVNQYGVTFRWKDGDYWCTVRFSDSSGVDFISLTLETPLK